MGTQGDKQPMNVEEFVRGLEKAKPAAWETLMAVEGSREAAMRCIALADDIYRGCLAGQRASMELEAGIVAESDGDKQTLRRTLWMPSGDRGKPKPLRQGAIHALASVASACTLVFHYRGIPTKCQLEDGSAGPHYDAVSTEEMNRVCVGFAAVGNVLASAIFSRYLHEQAINRRHIPAVVLLESVLSRNEDLTGPVTTMMETARHRLRDTDTGCETWDKCMSEVERKGEAPGVHTLSIENVKSRDDLPDSIPESAKDEIMKAIEEIGGTEIPDLNSDRMGPSHN